MEQHAQENRLSEAAGACRMPSDVLILCTWWALPCFHGAQESTAKWLIQVQTRFHDPALAPTGRVQQHQTHPGRNQVSFLWHYSCLYHPIGVRCNWASVACAASDDDTGNSVCCRPQERHTVTKAIHLLWLITRLGCHNRGVQAAPSSLCSI